MSEFILLVNSREFRGWESLRVTRNLESMSGTFSFGFSDKWAEQNEAWPIIEGDKCHVRFGDTQVMSGFVETCTLPLTGVATVDGKDGVADVLESSPRVQKYTFIDMQPLEIARALCGPFGVTVVLQKGLSLKKLKRFSVDPGDTVSSVLESLCRACGVMAMSDADGGIVLTRAGTEKCGTAIVQGENLEGGSAKYSIAGRFGEYRVLGQMKGNNDVHGPVTWVRASAYDKGVRAERLLVVRSEGGMSKQAAEDRVQWEATVRATRANQLSGVRVRGWTQGDGTLWPLNALVHVKAPKLRADGWYLISQVTFVLDGGGSYTEFELKEPGAFTPEPIIKKGDKHWLLLKNGVKAAPVPEVKK